jgi:hypothetical protein
MSPHSAVRGLILQKRHLLHPFTVTAAYRHWTCSPAPTGSPEARVIVTEELIMKHLLSSGSVTVHVESLAAVSALTLLLNLTLASAGAEPLVALGQERAQFSSNTLTTAAKTPSGAKDPVRKPHKLIKKSAPLATLHQSGTASSTEPTSLSAPTNTVQSTTTQTLSNDSAGLNLSASTTVAPTKTTSVTTVPATSLSLGGALATAPSTGTASSALPLSAVAAPGPSVQDKTNSGRGMQQLSTAMPGFNRKLP